MWRVDLYTVHVNYCIILSLILDMACPSIAIVSVGILALQLILGKARNSVRLKALFTRASYISQAYLVNYVIPVCIKCGKIGLQ